MRYCLVNGEDVDSSHKGRGLHLWLVDAKSWKKMPSLELLTAPVIGYDGEANVRMKITSSSSSRSLLLCCALEEPDGNLSYRIHTKPFVVYDAAFSFDGPITNGGIDAGTGMCLHFKDEQGKKNAIKMVLKLKGNRSTPSMTAQKEVSTVTIEESLENSVNKEAPAGVAPTFSNCYENSTTRTSSAILQEERVIKSDKRKCVELRVRALYKDGTVADEPNGRKLLEIRNPGGRCWIDCEPGSTCELLLFISDVSKNHRGGSPFVFEVSAVGDFPGMVNIASVKSLPIIVKSKRNGVRDGSRPGFKRMLSPSSVSSTPGFENVADSESVHALLYGLQKRRKRCYEQHSKISRQLEEITNELGQCNEEEKKLLGLLQKKKLNIRPASVVN